MRQVLPEQTIFDDQDETGAGNAILVEDFRHMLLALDISGTATLTIKFQGSTQDSEPDWTSAQAEGNKWEYIEVVDQEDGSSIAGDTGISPGAADDHRLLEANVNGLRWINARVTSHSAGEVDLTVKLFND